MASVGEEPGRAVDGLGQAEAAAGGGDGGGVADLGLDGHDVGHARTSSNRLMARRSSGGRRVSLPAPPAHRQGVPARRREAAES